MGSEKRTPLYPVYAALGARTVTFAGWEMPLQFSGIVDEHQAVRTAAGLFDVSHMGELEVRGPAALELVQLLVTNDVGRAADGQALYTLMCRADGGIIDDLLVYRLSVDHYLLVVNAANVTKDLEHVRAAAAGLAGVEVVDVSDAYALLALQGPLAEEIIRRLYEGDPDRSPAALRPFRFAVAVPLAGRQARIVSRTGYTGEDGFELYVRPEDAVPLWEALLEAGHDLGLKPAGLGARDTLRFEACLPLYGNELTEETNPLEAGLDRFVKLDKGPFLGREALVRVAAAGPTRRLIGLELEEGIARHGYPVTDGSGRRIGVVTSGTLSPTLRRSLALAFVPSEWAAVGNELAVDIRGKERRARIVDTPFYRRGQSRRGR